MTRHASHHGLAWPKEPGRGEHRLPGIDADSWLTAKPRGTALAAAAVAVAFSMGFVIIDAPRDALAAIVGLALIVVVLVRPLYGALGLVALVPTLSGLVPGVPVHNVRVSELLIGAVGVTLLVTSRRRAAVPWSMLDGLLLAYGSLWLLDGVIASVLDHQHLSISSWGTVAGQLQFFVLYRSLKVTLRTSEERHLALKVLFVASGFVALLAVAQELKVPGVISLIGTLTGSSAAGGVGGVIRATGPFANWAALAGYMMPLVFISLCFALGNAVSEHKRSQAALALLFALALFVTAELSIILCLLVGVCLLGVQYGRGKIVLRWMVIGLVVVAAVAGSLLGNRLNDQLSSSAGSGRHAGVPQTLNTRWSVWTQQYIPAIERQPLTGYGVDLPSSIRWPFPESQYIAFLIEGGVPLLALFGFLAAAMLREAKRAGRTLDPIDRALGRGLFAGVIVMLVVNLVWPFLSNGGMPQLLWCLFALLPPALGPLHPPRAERRAIRSATSS